jgi:hypothetical protein
MDSKTNEKIRGKIGIAGLSVGVLMAIALVVLKILDKIDLSWFTVIISFFYIPLTLIIFVVFLLIFVAGIVNNFK